MIEQVILVDRNDCEVGVEEKLAAHKAGRCHRAFSIFIFDDRVAPPRLLLQQRHPGKYHSGGLWSNTCCGHPRPGESVAAAASRRLQEELGLTIPLDAVGRFHYRAELDQALIENEVDHLFVGHYRGESIKPNPDEISQIDWVSVAQLQQRLISQPGDYTAWLSQGLEKVIAGAR